MTQIQRRGTPYRPKNWMVKRFELTFISLLNRFQFLEQIVRYIYGNIIISRNKWKSKRRGRAFGGDFEADKIYWVEPERIRYCSLLEFNIYKDKGNVIGGNWDRLKKNFNYLDVYIAFKEVFIEGKNWGDTSFYHYILDEIRNGKFYWGCKNKSDFDKRCENLYGLFLNIKNIGYKSQSELLFEENPRNPLQLEDEITVNVGRYGDLLFNNGAHRLAIAKLLGVQKIPVRITVRHSQWVDFRRQIALFSKEQPSGKIYQPITHPDLQDFPSFYDSMSERFNMIYSNLSTTNGRLLDIGAHWGYFCHKFEKKGFNCYAVENDERYIYFLRKLKRAENKHFKVIPRSIFKYRDIENLHFDVVLALNIFHHFLKNQTSYSALIKLLEKLKLSEMYFQPHNPSDPQMRDAYKNYSEEEFVKFILEATMLNKAIFIGSTEDGRKIYKLH